GGGSMVTNSGDEWERTFNICWGGVYNCTRAFLPMLLSHLPLRSGGRQYWCSWAPSSQSNTLKVKWPQRLGAVQTRESRTRAPGAASASPFSPDRGQHLWQPGPSPSRRARSVISARLPTLAPFVLQAVP